jgi:hypothetical protein
VERFNLKKLNAVEGKEQYRVQVSSRFATLENLNTEVEINCAWGTIRENIKILAKDSLAEAMVQQRMLRIIRSKEKK